MRHVPFGTVGAIFLPLLACTGCMAFHNPKGQQTAGWPPASTPQAKRAFVQVRWSVDWDRESERTPGRVPRNHYRSATNAVATSGPTPGIVARR